MGIQGLLPQLKSVTAKAHVSKYRGQRAAVDAYVLLHRGAYTCAREICEGEPTNRSRDENRAKARALWQQGNKTAAYECYQRAVNISPAVAKGFIDALKRQGVHFIVAPYEADAQMAYLALNGQVDVVITEDSDLLTYGCPRVFFKMDKSGDGEEVELRNLVHARELSFLGFTHDMFQEMCILAGCDFVKALPGVGIKKAHQQIRQRKSFVKVIKNLRFSGTPVPQDYERRVQRAIWTFNHQRIYCPQRRMLVHLRDVSGGKLGHGALVPAAAELADGEDDFLGPLLADDVAQAIATGQLDPITKLPYGAGLEGLPCTAPQQQDPPSHASQGSDADPGVLQNRRHHHHQQQQQQQGQQEKGNDSKAAALGNGGNTLANYGFLRHSGSAMKEFKRPRSSKEAGTRGQHQQEQQEGEPQDGPSRGASSPTMDELMTRGCREHGSGMGQLERLHCIPDSPAANSCGAAPPQPPQRHGDQQVTPGFYAVGGSEEQPEVRPVLCSPQLLEERNLLEDCKGPQALSAGGATKTAMSSLEHLPAFAQEAKAAVDRIAVQAVRESAAMALHAPQVQPPAYLQRRQQLQQSSSAALKRPFSVPRRVAAPDRDKENSTLGPANKRSKPEAPLSNMFSKFACK
ncbi:hypothetical protein N2152v2_005770 [Parachlorella kessleri]